MQGVTLSPLLLVAGKALRAESVSAPSAVFSSSTSAGMVYTNDDLRRAGGGRTPGAVPLQPPPPVVRASAQELGENEARWRDKAAERREAVRSAEQRAAALKGQIEQLERARQTSADGELERELAKMRDDLDSAQERLAKAQRRMEELQDEARRKGLPSDWLR